MQQRADRIAAREEGAWAEALRLAFGFLFLAVGVMALAWAASGTRRVPPDTQAVVFRFGRVARVQEAGLLLAWPRPVEQVVLLPAPGRQIEFPIVTFGVPAAQADEADATFPTSSDPRRNAAFLLTGDLGVVHLQATLFYQISDPAAYLQTGPHLAPALQRLFVAAAVAVCASRDLDTILVARPDTGLAASAGIAEQRERLRAALVRAVNVRLADLARQGAGLGVTVSRVDLAAALPSAAEIAFDRILTVTQTAERELAEAQTYAERVEQQAEQHSDRIASEAAAKAEERRSDAETRVTAITALLCEASRPSGGALIAQVYHDRIGELLRRAGQVDVIDPASGARFILPGAAQ